MKLLYARGFIDRFRELELTIRELVVDLCGRFDSNAPGIDLQLPKGAQDRNARKCRLGNRGTGNHRAVLVHAGDQTYILIDVLPHDQGNAAAANLKLKEQELADLLENAGQVEELTPMLQRDGRVKDTISAPAFVEFLESLVDAKGARLFRGRVMVVEDRGGWNLVVENPFFDPRATAEHRRIAELTLPIEGQELPFTGNPGAAVCSELKGLGIDLWKRSLDDVANAFLNFSKTQYRQMRDDAARQLLLGGMNRNGS